MARPLEVALAAFPHGTADLGEIQSRIRSGRTEGHYYVALLGLRTYEPLALYRQVRKGLAYSAFTRFQRNTSLSAKVISELTQIPSRTLTRRKSEGKLSPRSRTGWCGRPGSSAAPWSCSREITSRPRLAHAGQMALGGLVPLELAGTDVGSKEVENLIGRLEHGIPS